MARKNKNPHINLNNGPLKSVTIGEIKEKKHGFLGVLILLLLFMGLIYYLPNIQKYYQEYFGVPTSDSLVPEEKEEQKETKEDENEEETTKYLLAETPQYELEDVEVNEISFKEGLLTFKVKNKTTDSVDLTSQNLYFLTYDESGVLLNYVPIKGTINKDQTLPFSYSIKSNAHSFEIKTMTEEDYPYFNINEDSSGISRLVCNKNSDRISYTFDDSKLIRIEHSSSLEKTNSSYNSVYSTFDNIVQTHSGKNGITATLTSNENALNYNMVIDYSSFTETINYDYYFAKDTNPRKVNFILESNLFDCA